MEYSSWPDGTSEAGSNSGFEFVAGGSQKKQGRQRLEPILPDFLTTDGRRFLGNKEANFNAETRLAALRAWRSGSVVNPPLISVFRSRAAASPSLKRTEYLQSNPGPMPHGPEVAALRGCRSDCWPKVRPRCHMLLSFFWEARCRLMAAISARTSPADQPDCNPLRLRRRCC